MPPEKEVYADASFFSYLHLTGHVRHEARPYKANDRIFIDYGPLVQQMEIPDARRLARALQQLTGDSNHASS